MNMVANGTPQKRKTKTNRIPCTKRLIGLFHYAITFYYYNMRDRIVSEIHLHTKG